MQHLIDLLRIGDLQSDYHSVIPKCSLFTCIQNTPPFSLISSLYMTSCVMVAYVSKFNWILEVIFQSNLYLWTFL